MASAPAAAHPAPRIPHHQAAFSVLHSFFHSIFTGTHLDNHARNAVRVVQQRGDFRTSHRTNITAFLLFPPAIIHYKLLNEKSRPN